MVENNITLKISCSAGTILGKKLSSGVACFKGIPYACPPVGDFRWKPPVPLQHSLIDFPAFEFGAVPCQNADAVYDPMNFESYDLPPNMSEDCLTLNIWGRDNGEKKPVLFWIYGGAFIKGFGSCPLYDGEDLTANEDILLVTINHREGLLATLNLTALDSSEEYRCSNNLYLLDQIQALKWCYENIEAFGGDKDNITIYGHSSGSNSVTHLLLSEEAREYFSKAICQSSFFTGCGHTPFEWSGIIGRKVIELLGAKSMDEMKRIPVSEILKVQQKLFTIPFEGFIGKLFSPVTDGITVPMNPMQEILNGKLADKPVMFGYSDGEYDQMFMREPDEELMLQSILSRIPKEFSITDEIIKGFVKNMPERTKKQAYLDLYNEIFMHSAMLFMADAFVKGGGTCYMYCFKWWEDQYKRRAPHGAPNAFVFGNSLIPPNAPPQLKRQIQRTWKQFMETGNPQNDLICEWNPYTKEDPCCMMIDRDWHRETDWKRADFELVAPFFQEYEELNT